MVRLIHSSEDASESEIDRAALAWVVRLTSGHSTADDHRAFREWRDGSAEHRAALHRARTLWQKVGHVSPPTGQARRIIPTRVCAWPTLPIAASLLIVVGAWAGYDRATRFDHETARGEQRVVELPDGSRMTMAGDTKVDVRFDVRERRLDIGAGSVLLDVKHEPRRPFEVVAARTRFRDVGTTFGVTRREGGAQLVVAEGLVDAIATGRRERVSAGYALSVVDDRIGTPARVDPRRLLGWARGRLIYRDRRLADIVGELAPHYRGRIVLLNDRAGDERLSASIEIGYIDDWLDALRRTRDVTVWRIAGYTLIF